MERLTVPYPAYDLYGDADPLPAADLFHGETIRLRSERHRWEIAPHVHPALFQALFVYSGQIELQLGKRRASRAGPLLVVAPSGLVHGFRFSPDTIGLVCTVARAFVESLARQDALYGALREPAVRTVPRTHARRLLRLGREWLQVEDERFMAGTHRLHRLLAEAWLRLALEPVETGGPAGLALRFQALVETHYRSHQPLSFYAHTLGCTERTLARQVGAAHGATPRQLVNRRLLREAQQLLRFTNASAADIAAELGFADPSYFSRFYLRMAGRRPSAEKAAQGGRR